MEVQYTICHWAINRTDPQNLLSMTLDVPLQKGGRTVGHSEEHHKRFEEAIVGTEGHFLFISGLDAYIIETPLDIKFCEVLGFTELGDEFGDEEERVPVLDSYSVQHVIVLD